ncbi:hypothetical protein [Erythrobacter sp. MTPC3]
MTKAIALSKTALDAANARRAEIAQSVAVIALAAALIFAGQPVPL